MKTIIKTGMWKILKLFYDNRNSPLHLREISRKAGRNESSIFRQLKILEKEGIVKSKSDGNMKKFFMNPSNIPDIFPIFDYEKFNSLPLIRKNAVKFYLSKLEKKPVFAVLFGSTAKGNYIKDSDIDILEVINCDNDNRNANKYAEAQTGIKLQIFRINEKQFRRNLLEKKDKVVLSAIETGFPIFNNKYFCEVIYNE